MPLADSSFPSCLPPPPVSQMDEEIMPAKVKKGFGICCPCRIFKSNNNQTKKAHEEVIKTQQRKALEEFMKAQEAQALEELTKAQEARAREEFTKAQIIEREEYMNCQQAKLEKVLKKRHHHDADDICQAKPRIPVKIRNGDDPGLASKQRSLIELANNEPEKTDNTSIPDEKPYRPNENIKAYLQTLSKQLATGKIYPDTPH